MVMSFSDLSTWCYACDSYVENPVLREIKSSAYKAKFNETLD
jgi:histone deacetylase 6